MASSIMDITPFIPSDAALVQWVLPDKAISLISQSARLTGAACAIKIYCQFNFI